MDKIDISKFVKLSLTYIDGHIDDAMKYYKYEIASNHIKSAKGHLRHLLKDIVDKSDNLTIDLDKDGEDIL